MMDLMSTIEVEKKLLSGLMLKNGLGIPEVAEVLRAEDFYRPEHKLIYKALIRLMDANEPVDAVTVEAELKKSDDLKRVTWQYLMGLIPLEYTTGRLKRYSAIVQEASLLRQLKDLGEELQGAAVADVADPAQVIATVEERLTELETRSVKSNLIDAKEVLLRAYDIHTQADGLWGLSTGFVYLDKLTGGLKKADLIILAARPSMGKTALAMNIATNVAKEHSVIIFSLEMSAAMLGVRMLSAASGVPANRIQHKSCSQEQEDRLIEALEDLYHLKLSIDDTMGLTLTTMKMLARKKKRESGLDLIVVDYLQLIQCSNRYAGNRVQEVTELSRGLKELARELDIPILCLSQLSRQVEMRADKRPLLADLRESGAIEQDADIVLMLYREGYYKKDADPYLATLIVGKNRNGATGEIPLDFNRDCLLFRNITR